MISVHAGEQLDHFQIERLVARSGMASIFQATDLRTGQTVAIKIPHPEMESDPVYFERFQREEEIGRKLNHPGVMKVIPNDDRHDPYIVMEWVPGRLLRQVLSETHKMPPERAIKIVVQICKALDHIHSHGVIHRDLKPENILITAEGQPIIMDFGLALTKSAHRVTYSNLSATMGTPDYMAPEQIEGQRGDQRTDVYALGTILFELLAGRIPFQGDSNMAVMGLHLNNTAPRLDRVNPSISPQLAAIAARCLARDPANRYPDMAALIEALDHPETVDLSILDQAQSAPTGGASVLQSQVLKAIGISALIMAVIVALALALQALR